MNLLELEDKLLRFQSTSLNELEMVNWIEDLLLQNKLKTTKDVFNVDKKDGIKTTANLYVEVGNKSASGKNTLVIYAHTDVVSAKPEQFIPKIEGGKIYARGTADMKSALCSQFFVLLNHKEQLEKLSKKIIFAFIADEETSSQGIRRFVTWAEQNDLRDFSMIFMEPSNDFERINVGGKGCIFLDLEGEIKDVIKCLKKIKIFKKNILEKYKDQNDGFGPSTMEITKITPEQKIATSILATGKSTHASRPWFGENALENALDRYQEITYLKTSDETTSNTIPDKCEVIVGSKELKMKCKACLDIRTNLVGDKNDSLLNDIMDLIDKTIKTNLRMKDRAYLIKDRTLIEIAKNSVSKTVEEIIAIGGSDAPFVLDLTDCLVSGFGPGRSELCHTINENIDIKILEETPKIILKIIDGFEKI